MIDQIFFKILALKVSLVIGLTGFLTVPQQNMVSRPDNYEVSLKTEKTVNKAFQTLPASLRKAEYQPRPNGVSKFAGPVSAQSYLVLDEKSEIALTSLGENTVRPIGSISKLMAMIVFLKTNPKWDRVITSDPADSRQGNTYIYEGEKTSLRNFFNVALVGSSNSAVMSLVRSTGLGEKQFVAEMNEEAEKTGLDNTFFSEPTGLSSQNKSTARDVAALLKRALAMPEIQEAVTTKTYEFAVTDAKDTKRSRRAVNTNQLLFSDLGHGPVRSIIGGKTGFIEEAGHCFAVEVENSMHNKIIVVVLGSDSEDQRFSEAKILADWVFKSYAWPGQEISADK